MNVRLVNKTAFKYGSLRDEYGTAPRGRAESAVVTRAKDNDVLLFWSRESVLTVASDSRRHRVRFLYSILA